MGMRKARASPHTVLSSALVGGGEEDRRQGRRVGGWAWFMGVPFSSQEGEHVGCSLLALEARELISEAQPGGKGVSNRTQPCLSWGCPSCWHPVLPDLVPWVLDV